ncbi:MAG: hypothetical protein ABWZ42_09250, partial [Ilumatobacteraceae bacterium]
SALRSVVGGRRVILAGSVAAAWTEHLPVLRAAGATELLVVATEGAGVGLQPAAPTVVVTPPSGLRLMERIHFSNRALEEPSPAVVEAVREFDPDRTAVVIGTFLNTASHLDGRAFLAYRRPEWVALEDKVVVDAFWDRAGVVRQPSVVVPLADAAEAARSLDRGRGTVWAADARDGFHGGAEHTHWVADEPSASKALGALADHCDRVRVMPFVDGVPCSIHGMVLPDGLAVLRPVEMVVLRRILDDGSREFFYAGCATFWDPSDDIRAQMVDAARRAGEQLRAEVDFKGTFTVDGVAAPDGFWPTELNPRFGAGITTIARAGGDVPILLINEVVGSGLPLGIGAADIERQLMSIADAHRGGGTWKPGLSSPVAVDERPAVFESGAWRWASDDDDRAAIAGTVMSGESIVRCRYAPGATPVGPSTGERAAAFWRFAAAEFGTPTADVFSAGPD